MIELHLHLEGAIPLSYFLPLCRREPGAPKTLAELEEKFQYRNFAHFIELWGWKNQFIRRESDFQGIALAVLENLHMDGIQYVEAFCSPGDFRRQGLSVSGILDALHDGIAEAEEQFPIRCRLIVDLIRDHGPETGRKYLDAATLFLSRKVIGVGLGGSEQLFPARDYADLFAEARARGFHTVAHAGEVAGPESVRQALAIGAERIGHGVRAIEDPELVVELAKRQIPLEICPTSNLRTGLYPDYRSHPVAALHRSGCLVTLASDDPVMFNCTLSGEYSALARETDLTTAELTEISNNGQRAAFHNFQKS